MHALRYLSIHLNIFHKHLLLSLYTHYIIGAPISPINYFPLILLALHPPSAKYNYNNYEILCFTFKPLQVR